MVLGIGIDSIEIMRVMAACRKEAFVARTFSPNEQAYFAARNNNAQVLAGNFAAKEAVLKAMGIGLGQARLTDIEVLRKESGQPYVLLHGRAKEQFEQMGGARVLVSIAHDRWRAVAQALIEGEGRT
nr:holo-ACP synthase [Maliibacterium massiliense]